MIVRGLHNRVVFGGKSDCFQTFVRHSTMLALKPIQPLLTHMELLTPITIQSLMQHVANDRYVYAILHQTLDGFIHLILCLDGIVYHNHPESVIYSRGRSKGQEKLCFKDYYSRCLLPVALANSQRAGVEVRLTQGILIGTEPCGSGVALLIFRSQKPVPQNATKIVLDKTSKYDLENNNCFHFVLGKLTDLGVLPSSFRIDPKLYNGGTWLHVMELARRQPLLMCAVEAINILWNFQQIILDKGV